MMECKRVVLTHLGVKHEMFNMSQGRDREKFGSPTGFEPITSQITIKTAKRLLVSNTLLRH